MEEKEILEEEKQEVEEVVEKTSTMEPIIDDKKGSKKPFIITGIVMFAVIVIGLIGLLLPSLLMNNKNIVKREVATVFSQLKKSIKEAEKNTLEFNLDEESVGVEGSLKVKSNYKNSDIDLTKLDKYNITYSGVIDKKDNKASLGLKLADNKDIVGVDAFVKGKDVYVDLGDLFNKTLTSEMDKEIKDLEVNSLDYDDIIKILDKTENSIKENINDSDVSKEMVEKEINGKKKKYTKVAYKVNVNDQTEKLLTAYKEDEDIVEILSDLSSVSEKEIKEALDEGIKSAKEAEKEEFDVNVYLDGLFNKVVSLEVVDENNSLVVDVNGKVYNYRLMDNDKEIASGVVDKGKNTMTFVMKNDDVDINFEMKEENNNKVSGNLKVDSNGTKINLDFDMTSKRSGKKLDTTLNAKVDLEVEKEKFNFEINSNTKTELDKKPTEVKVRDAKKLDDLSETELNDLYSNLMKKVEPILKEVMPSYTTNA